MIKRIIKVSAVVVTYNRLNILKSCINHLLNQSYPLNDIIIIDNNSDDGTGSYLKRLNNSEIKYKILHKNLGGSGGFFIGTKFAFEKSDSKYFWLMDDDTLPSVNALKKFIHSAIELNGKFGFLCGNVRLRYNNVPVNIPHVSRDWTRKLPGNLIKVDQASFVSLFVPRKVVSQVGLPIRQMFIWGDDYEYTLRISRQEECYFVANSLIIHNTLINNNGLKNSENIFNSNRIQFYEYATRNYLYTDKKYFGIKGAAKNILGAIFNLIKIPFISKNRRIKRFSCLFIGLVDGLFFNPKIEFPKK